MSAKYYEHYSSYIQWSEPQLEILQTNLTTRANGCMYEWMNEWMNEWMHECMNECLNECMNEWMNVWMNVWINV